MYFGEVNMRIQPVTQHGPVFFPDLEMQKWQKKLKEFGFSDGWIHEHPDCARFLFESGIIHQIVCLKNSSEYADLHDIRCEGSMPLLQVEGRRIPWSEFKKVVRYDQASHRIVSHADSKEGWNYVSPHGFVRKERYEYQEIYPVEQLSKEAHEELLTHAHAFFQTNPEHDVGEKKEAIYQLVTSLRDWNISENCLNKNFIDNLPRHISLRLIQKKYIEPLTSCFPYTCLTTTNAHVAVPDYEETHLFQERVVTSIPITQARLTAALGFLSTLNTNGIRFNVMKQNCTSLGKKLLNDFGYDIDTRYTFSELFYSFLPNITDMPCGHAVHRVYRTTCAVAQTVFELIRSITPHAVQHTISWVISPITRVLHATCVVIRNIVVLTLGGGLSAYWEEPVANENKQLIKPFLYLHRMVHRWSDLLQEETFDFHYSQTIVEWQRKQPSTHTYRNSIKAALYL